MIILEMMPLLLIVIGITFLVVGIKHIIRCIRFEKQGIDVQQPNLSNLGNMLTFIGTIGASIFDRLTGIRFDMSEISTLYLSISGIVGFVIFYIGIKLREAAYKKPDEKSVPRENLKWLKLIMNLFKK